MNKTISSLQQYFPFPRKKSNPKVRVNPRYRAYGRARIDIIQRVKTQTDWDALWKPAANPFPFEFRIGCTHCIEYTVDDYPTEVGFFTDFLGFTVDEFGPQYARFTSPSGDYFIGVCAAIPGQASSPSTSFKVQFFVRNLMATYEELCRRGIDFSQPPKLRQPGASQAAALLCTPHGIQIELIGEVAQIEPSPNQPPSSTEQIDRAELESPPMTGTRIPKWYEVEDAPENPISSTD